jgi:hypothetical protein
MLAELVRQQVAPLSRGVFDLLVVQAVVRDVLTVAEVELG